MFLLLTAAFMGFTIPTGLQLLRHLYNIMGLVAGITIPNSGSSNIPL